MDWSPFVDKLGMARKARVEFEGALYGVPAATAPKFTLRTPFLAFLE